MFFNHCVDLLLVGRGSDAEGSYTDLDRVVFKLEAGVSVDKLEGIQCALLMIEALKLSNACDETRTMMFDHFIEWTYRNFRKPAAMAVLKYAIADRRIKINHKESAAWGVVFKSFEPRLLRESVDVREIRIERQYKRYYAKLKSFVSVSDRLLEYLVGEINSPSQRGGRELSARLH